MGVRGDLVTTKKSSELEGRFRECFEKLRKNRDEATFDYMPPEPANEDSPISIFARERGRLHKHYALQAAVEDEGLCESPIEKLLFWAILCELHWAGWGLSIGECAGWAHLNHPVDPNIACVEPQAPIDRFHVDILVTLKEPHSDFKALLIAVECDGHEFHEKTKEQASHDKRRDRELQKSGLIVARFSGSDIWGDPFKCAREVIELGNAELHRRWGIA